MSVFQIVLASWLGLTILIRILLIGEPREPIKPQEAAMGAIINSAFILGLVLGW